MVINYIFKIIMVRELQGIESSIEIEVISSDATKAKREAALELPGWTVTHYTCIGGVSYS